MIYMNSGTFYECNRLTMYYKTDPWHSQTLAHIHLHLSNLSYVFIPTTDRKRNFLLSVSCCLGNEISANSHEFHVILMDACNFLCLCIFFVANSSNCMTIQFVSYIYSCIRVPCVCVKCVFSMVNG